MGRGSSLSPPAAAPLSLDRSGSMSAWSGGHTKLQLAIEAALAAAGTLRNHDRVAIGAVDEQTTWFQPLGHLSDLVRRREHIRSMGELEPLMDHPILNGVALERVAPGRWMGRAPDADDAAFLLARIRDPQGRTFREIATTTPHVRGLPSASPKRQRGLSIPMTKLRCHPSAAGSTSHTPPLWIQTAIDPATEITASFTPTLPYRASAADHGSPSSQIFPP